MRPVLVAGAVAVLVAAAVGVADAVPPPGAGAPGRGTTVAVNATALACPQGGVARAAGHTTVLAAALGPPAGVRAADVPAVRATPVPAAAGKGLGAAPLLTADGRLGTADASALPDRGIALLAQGATAAGLVAEQVTTVAAGPHAGVAVAACPAPHTSWWFVGPTGALDTYDQLVLTNLDQVPALVDVTLDGHDGPLAVPAAQGLSVPADGRLTVPLAQLAPGEAATAVHVVASTGRVVAAVLDARQAAGVPEGLDWVPASAPPSRQVTVPGVTSAASRRVLVLADPGGTATTVTVHVAAAGGSFVPAGLQRLALPAGAVRTVDVSQALGAGAAGVVVTAGAPVLAGVLMITGDSQGGSELAWSAGSRALSGPTAVPVPPAPSGGHAALVLTAPDGTAQALVSGGAGARGPVEVAVPAGATRELDLNGGAGLLTVTPQPGSGPLHAALVLAGGPGSTGRPLSVLPLSSPARVLTVPPVRLDPAVEQG